MHAFPMRRRPVRPSARPAQEGRAGGRSGGDVASTSSTSAPVGALRLGPALAALAAVGAAPPAAYPRVELPVRLVTLPDGTVRFGVPVSIGGRTVEAGLDTGSTGLRVMARALPADARGLGRVRYGYGAGTVLDGPEVTAAVGFGDGPPAPVRVQRVEALSCSADHPDCPVRRNADAATFGIQGNGFPNQGFAAILGVNLRAAGQPNPFEALGVRRWIVDLPVPGGAGAGRIVLNPTAEEAAGYRAVRFGGDRNTIPACVAGPAIGRACGSATIDSGAPGLRVIGASARAAPPAGAPLTVTLGHGAEAVTFDVASERRDQGSHLTLERRIGPDQPDLFLGVAPYYRFSILYDADAKTIGFKPR